jgi:PAS domain S-box-containing protein
MRNAEIVGDRRPSPLLRFGTESTEAKPRKLRALSWVFLLATSAYLVWRALRDLGSRVASSNLPIDHPPVALIMGFLTFGTALSIVLYLEVGVRERKHKSRARLDEVAAVIADLSSHVTSRSPQDLDGEVDGILRRAMEALGACWIAWYREREPDSRLERTYSANVLNAPPVPAVIKLQQIPQLAERMIRGEISILRGVGDLPAHAHMDRSFFQDLAVKSLHLIPSNVKPVGLHVLAIAFRSEEDQWASGIAVYLSTLANLLTTVMERQETTATRLKIEPLFVTLFKSAPIGIALEDLEGRPLFANPAICSLLGYTEDEMRSKHCVEFSPPEDSSKDWLLFEQLRAGSIDSYQLDKRFIRKDGSLTWGRLNISMLNDRGGSAPMVVATVEDISEQRATEENLRRSELSLRSLAARMIQAQEEERHRISRELHDDIGQRLALLKVDLENLHESLVKSGASTESEIALDLHRKSDELASVIRDLSHDLHSSKLKFLGLPQALRDICERISRQQNIHTALFVENLPRNLVPELELCIFRVAQEALNNVVKHSRAQEAFVEITYCDGAICLKVRDFGVGFDQHAPHGGIGLSTMRERLRILGGELFVDSVSNHGTEIVAKVKLEGAKPDTSGPE